jgi:DNA-binding transcriptional regulator GbsR (MarR family)
MARSNVSNSLKELIGWKLIRRVPVLGDRRDHFEAEADLLAALRACVAEANGDPHVGRVARERLAEMQRFVETLNR